MKLAVLHRYASTLKNLCNTALSIDHYTRKIPSFLEKRIESLFVDPRRFKLRFFP
jgi:hypothetical protein